MTVIESIPSYDIAAFATKTETKSKASYYRNSSGTVLWYVRVTGKKHHLGSVIDSVTEKVTLTCSPTVKVGSSLKSISYVEIILQYLRLFCSLKTKGCRPISERYDSLDLCARLFSYLQFKAS